MSIFAGTEFFQPAKCERCELLEEECQCPPLEPEKVLMDPSKQTARISTEKRRKGKVVTVIRGLAAENNDLPGLLKTLKNHCGAGGSIQEDAVEIQGDCRERVQRHLSEIGFKTKIIG